MPLGNPIRKQNESRIVSVLATEGQTVFTVQGGYIINQISVFRNGVRLSNSEDFTAGDGSTVTLNTEANVNDRIEFHIFDTFTVQNAIVGAASSQTISGDLVVNGKIFGNLDVPQINVASGIVTTHDLNVTGVSTFADTLFIDDALSHSGDSDTRLRFPAADVVSVETAGAEQLRVTSDGELLIGTTTVTPHVRLNQKLGVVQVGNYGGVSLTNYGGTAAVNKAILDFNRSRGTSNASMTSVASNDGLGHVVFRGADGTNFVDSVGIRAQVDGTPGTNNMPGRLVFETTPSGSNSLSERLRIASDGHVAIGGYGDPGSILDVREDKDGAETMIRLFNTDNGDTTTQTAALYLSPDSRGTALTGLRAIKENASFATNAGRDVSLTLNVLQNNSQLEALSITSGGDINIHNRTAASTTDPVTVDFGGQYTPDASITHQNLKVKLFSNASGNDSGGLTMGQSGISYVSSVGAGHLFYTAPSAVDTLFERVRISHLGYVGVGTNSPTNIVDINGNQPSAVADVYIRNHAPNGGTALNLFSQGTYGSPLVKGVFGSATSGDNIRVGAVSNHPLIFLVNNNDKLNIQTNGRVGINSTVPNAQLDVFQESTTAPSLTFKAASGQILRNEASELAFGLSNATPYPFYMQARTNVNAARDLAINPLGGNVLMGTTQTANHHRLGNLLVIAGTEAYTGQSITQYSSTAAYKALFDFNKSKGSSIGDMTSLANGDGIAHIVFRGADGTNFVDSAGIRCDVDKVPGSNSVKGKISIETGSTGTVNETIVATSDGYVLHPRQPAFSARAGSSRNNVSNQVLVFNTALFNIGNHYDTANSKFVVPYAGRYLFGGSPAYMETNDTMSIQIRVNGSTVFEIERVVAGSMLEHSMFGFSTMLNLTTDDYVDLYLTGECHQNGTYSHWFGYLLG